MNNNSIDKVSIFIKDLNLSKEQLDKNKFLILPLKMYHHFSIILISLEKGKLFLLDSGYDNKGITEKFGQFPIEVIFKYKIQLDSICAYFMEAMCIVLSKYENIQKIINECHNGIFLVKTFAQFGQMFELKNNETVIIPFKDKKHYYKIKIQCENNEFIYGLKKDFSNQFFFNFIDVIDKIIPHIDQNPYRICIRMESNKLADEIYIKTRIYNILQRVHNNIEEAVNSLLELNEYKSLDEPEKRRIKKEAQSLLNKSQMENKGPFKSILFMYNFFKKDRNAEEAIGSCQQYFLNEIED